MIFPLLRPRECILALEKYGTHTTCVCSYHQNCKLIIDSLQRNKLCDAKDYREIINMCLCEDSIRTTNCTLNECDKCPGTEKLAKQIELRLEEKMIERVSYKQWITVSGKTSLETITKAAEDFIPDFCRQIEELIPHDFISKEQSKYLKYRQDNIQPNKIVLIYDFSENYSCTVQDAVQAYHWSTPQVTVHPICMYYKGADGELKNQSLVIISENLNHNFLAVFAFQRKLIDYIKKQEKFRHIKKLTIFSDGAPTQYKNKFNFYNTCLFKEYFGYEAELHFFATAHGKFLIGQNFN